MTQQIFAPVASTVVANIFFSVGSFLVCFSASVECSICNNRMCYTI